MTNGHPGVVPAWEGDGQRWLNVSRPSPETDTQTSIALHANAGLWSLLGLLSQANFQERWKTKALAGREARSQAEEAGLPCFPISCQVHNSFLHC